MLARTCLLLNLLIPRQCCTGGRVSCTCLCCDGLGVSTCVTLDISQGLGWSELPGLMFIEAGRVWAGGTADTEFLHWRYFAADTIAHDGSRIMFIA